MARSAATTHGFGVNQVIPGDALEVLQVLAR